MSAAPQNGHALAESLTGIPHAGHLRVTPTGGRRGSGRSRPLVKMNQLFSMREL